MHASSDGSDGSDVPLHMSTLLTDATKTVNLVMLNLMYVIPRSIIIGIKSYGRLNLVYILTSICINCVEKRWYAK